jgi:CRISPR-associated protein Csd2
MTVLSHRIDFVLLFDVTNGNPNGDPDMGNMPRVDPETRLGLVTDVCLKRKVRNYVGATKTGAKGYDIYVREKAVLNDQHKKAYEALGIEPEKGKRPTDDNKARAITKWMCDTFFDIRTFGAVMTTDVNAGQVRGPVQMAFARSIDSITPLNISITRMAVTTTREAEAQRGDNRTMGDKWIVPYGLYRTHGFISAHLAQKTGFTEGDLALFWEALGAMFDHDRSAARGEMTCRGVYAFRHDNALGNAPAHKLFDLVKVQKTIAKEAVARSFGDYSTTVSETAIPSGVLLQRFAV